MNLSHRSRLLGRDVLIWASISLFCLVGSASDLLSATPTASYTVTFYATWSEETHPISFPPNPHFSGLIGGSHSASVTFWEVGQLATLGIQRMAEWGAKSFLEDEVEAAILAGTAEAVISGGGIGNSPGMVSKDFDLSLDHPLVTIVSMIAPSPDWFVGVSGLDLLPGGEWVQELVVELLPYDAGTDSGINYTSPDNPTVPHVPVFLKTDGPFVGGVPLGTFTFTRTDPPTAVPQTSVFATWNFPNPFNPRTTIAYRMPEAGHLSLTLYDLRGSLVSVLVDATVEQGDGSVVWDGSNQRGRPMPAGTYLLRAQADRWRSSRKISLVR